MNQCDLLHIRGRCGAPGEACDHMAQERAGNDGAARVSYEAMVRRLGEIWVEHES